jgi:hypothetical protein
VGSDLCIRDSDCTAVVQEHGEQSALPRAAHGDLVAIARDPERAEGVHLHLDRHLRLDHAALPHAAIPDRLPNTAATLAQARGSPVATILRASGGVIPDRQTHPLGIVGFHLLAGLSPKLDELSGVDRLWVVEGRVLLGEAKTTRP